MKKFSQGISYLILSLFTFVLSFENTITKTDKIALIALAAILLLAYFLKVFSSLKSIGLVGAVGLILSLIIELPMGAEKIILIIVAVILISIFVFLNLKKKNEA